ncbi:hypothetical protein [Tellurirhabdus bombi]|uniref:hypothetical protein n=1 Tax=Tellurirhabdus bombi TaxID=2907205 RepID=UPI001F417AAE|nr:hypothetical protein [Tellurirhabdus bombi]
MKRIKMLLLGCSMALCSLTAFADDPETDKKANAEYVTRTKTMTVAAYPNREHTKMHFIVENHIDVPLYVTFLGKNDQELYSQKVGKHKKPTHQVFNLQDLPNGDYQIVVSDGYNKVIKSFRIDTREVQVPKTTRWLTALE